MKTAFSGPIVVYGDRNPPGTAATASVNPDKAPSVFWGGTALMDPRVGFNLYRYGTIGHGPGTSHIPVLDVVPSALADNNIAAVQTPGSSTAALTLVTSTGAGITVTSAASRGLASGLTIASGTLIIETAPTVVSFGLANLASGFTSVSLYSASTLVARNVRITSSADDHLITFTVVGYDAYGYAMTETITGAAGAPGTASGAKAFKYITSVTPSAAVGGTVKVGTGDVYGFPLRVDTIGYVSLVWAGSLITANTGWVAAVTTTASATTGDVRGTYATQSASNDTLRLQAFITPSTANIGTTTGLYGVAQA